MPPSSAVCDVLPLIINNPDMRLPASLLYKYMHKAAEFYIGYVTRGPSADSTLQGTVAHETRARTSALRAQISVLHSSSHDPAGP